MNLFELFIVVSIIMGGYFCGKWLGAYWGLFGWIGGFVLGSSLVLGIGICLKRIISCLNRWHPLRPNCKNGKCSSNDYKLIESRKDGAIFICRCGIKYFQNWPKQDRFMEVLDDGSIIPYMKRKGIFGKWEKDIKRF